jgi:hypothetical protein
MTSQKRRASRHQAVATQHAAGVEALEELEMIFASLRDLLSRAYEQGGANAASRIFHLMKTQQGAPYRGELPEKPLTRAPRGAARRFVEKALADGAKTIKEIRDTAETRVEKFLSYQTVRLELLRGTAEKRYKKAKGRWSLLPDKT